MPTVGKGKDAKHFPYTKEGRKDAKEYAEKAGMRKRDKNLKNKGKK